MAWGLLDVGSHGLCILYDALVARFSSLQRGNTRAAGALTS
jgi:hypothetical protein